MAVEIKMPNLSQTTDVVKLLKWLVKKGDRVKKGDVLCEVETDKVNMEVESFSDGFVLRLDGDPGQEVKTGTVIAVLGEKGETIYTALSREGQSTGEGPETGRDEVEKEDSIPDKTVQKVRATKLVQRLAENNNISLAEIKGTGPRGTIVKKDLEDYINKKNKKIIKEEASDVEYWDLTPNQQAVSANLSKSKSSIPHYYLKSEILADKLIENRNTADSGNKLSIYSYFIYYSAKVLVKYPRLNGYFKDNRIYKNKHINVGFAVASDDELYVPVIKSADKKQMEDIDREVKLLASRAQDKKLGPDDISGGTFTISNLGIYPVNEFYGVINYPQAVLLAVGNIQKVLKVNEDNSMAVKNILNITCSFDHRIANGAQAAEFLTEIKRLLEEVK